MKKFLVLLLAALTFSVLLAAGCDGGAKDNILKFNGSRITCTLKGAEFSAYVGNIERVTLMKNLASSYKYVSNNKEDIKEIFNEFLGEGEKVFEKVQKEEYTENLHLHGVLSIKIDGKEYHFHFKKETKQIYYADYDYENFYRADGCDFDALVEKYCKY